MSLWLLTRIDPGPHYDRYIEFVVRAGDERHAREAACRLVVAHMVDRYGYADASDLDASDIADVHFWLNESLVQAVRIDPDGDTGVIASNFRHG